MTKLSEKHVFPTYRRNIIFVLFHGHFCSFTGIVFYFFSRASNWVSRARFDEKFHVHFFMFFEVFSRARIFFHGEKNTALDIRVTYAGHTRKFLWSKSPLVKDHQALHTRDIRKTYAGHTHDIRWKYAWSYLVFCWNFAHY